MTTRLTETEAELVTRSNALFIEVSVVDVEALRVVVVAADDRGAVIGCLLCDGVGQFAAGRGRAVQDVDETIARFLAGHTRVVSNDVLCTLSCETLTQPRRWLVRWHLTRLIRG